MKNTLWCLMVCIVLQGCEKDPFLDDSGGKQPHLQDDVHEGSWTRKADFKGFLRNHATGFSIGNKGYIGTGYLGGFVNDFWEYDAVTNSWSQKADFAGGKRAYAVGFSIGDKGYIFGGENDLGLEFQYRDLWEYDPGCNCWTKRADLPGKGRSQAVGFSIGAYGYVGTGYVAEYVQLDDCVVLQFPPTSDFWQYNPATDSWIEKAPFEGGPRFEATGFSIGDKGYLGTGQDSRGDFEKDVWEYNVVLNKWKRVADFAGQERSQAVAFGINSLNKGYIGFGWGFTFPTSTSFGDFWEYDPLTDKWSEMTKLNAVNYMNGVAFSIDEKGYIGSGLSGTAPTEQFWEFNPLGN